MELPDVTSWLVTGATGFLGANLGAHRAGRGSTIGVVRPGRPVPAFFDAGCGGTLESSVDLSAAVADARPDVIVHTAALASHEVCERDPHRAFQVNATATGLLASAAQRIGARFVYISTDAVFDGERGHYSEGDATRPTSVYGRSKLAGEEQAAAATDALIIRTNFFGWSPTGTRSILEFFVNELGAGNPVRGFTDFTTTSAYAQALAQIIEDLVAIDATGLFHVTSPDALTKYQFGVAVAEQFNLDATLITPTTADIHPPRTGDISLDVGKVTRTLGRALPSQREGIARAHADALTLRPALQGRPAP